MFFNHQIALLKKNVSSKEVAFELLANELMEKQCVNQDFLANVIKRELVFPTGLEINGIGVAIPHTDSEYVKESQVAFMSLTTPIQFKSMGSKDKEVNVSILFMLALKEPHEQLEMLQRLIEMFQQEGVLQALMTAETMEAYQKIIRTNGLS
ncbi:PTS sugar transporter subunit IIA [Candidatus Enterococcus clewellii]|uniref:PTS system, galactitol-specific IIA component n=1 Tax=Candidatus Enterococcus clewellii TaxID=1834193 RepID=A0A242K6H8_9ENTE|nr:PTS sugar transporter subunit IIA [Enterococcus sp. 9E7_DIV0242]OTP15921.1 hypothetical protein A5888_002135 [Enterococcus sp. 9E7_DIV0242]